MAEAKPEVRPYQPGLDEEKIVALFNRIFEEKITPALWRHKYAENPAGGWAFLTFIEGELVSVSGWPARWFLVDGSRVRVVSMSDVMVHPAWRGRFGGRLGSMARPLWEEIFKKENIPFGVAFPNPKHYLVGKRFVRAKDLGEFEIGVKAFTRYWRLPVLAETLRRLKAVFASLPDGIEIKPFSPEEASPKIEEELERLWQAVAPKLKVAYVKDTPSLQWRYFRWEALSPVKTRYFYLVYLNGRKVGFLVLKKVFTGKMPGFELEEILCLPEQADLLLHTAQTLALRAGGHFLRYLLSPAFGFKAEHLERKAPSLWRTFAYEGDQEDLAKRLAPKHWHLSMGDLAV